MERELRTVAITGVTGFIGRNLLKHLEFRNNVEIRALTYNKEFGDESGKGNVKLISGDLLHPETFDKLLTKGCTVVNLAYAAGQSEAENMEALDNLGKACTGAKIKRLIHCSTAVVAGRVSENIINEDTWCKPIGSYEVMKLAMENMLIEKYSGLFEIVIVRPTAVFGPGGQNIMKMADSLMRGNRVINYLKSCLFNNRKMNLVSVENVVAAIEFLIYYEKTNMSTERFIISDDEDGSNEYRKVELSLMSYFGQKNYSIPIIPIPLSILDLLLRLAGRTNPDPSCVYSSRKLMDVGFRKTVCLEESLRDFADWYKSNIVR